MIDDIAVRERVEEMNKANFKNLLRAFAVEKYLFDIFGSAVDTRYNPEIGAMVVRCCDPRSNAIKNVVESVKRSAGEVPGKVRYFSTRTESGARMEFSGGFSAMVMRAVEAR